MILKIKNNITADIARAKTAKRKAFEEKTFLDAVSKHLSEVFSLINVSSLNGFREVVLFFKNGETETFQSKILQELTSREFKIQNITYNKEVSFRVTW